MNHYCYTDLTDFLGKTHKFISTQWGFNGVAGENVALAGGIVCLLCGPAGVGKTAIAHSIAYELGQPIKVNGDVLTLLISLVFFLGS